MVKIYVMNTCKDCTYIYEQVRGNSQYELIDIGEHVRNLKAFLKLRDREPQFDVMKRLGTIGIPCFVLEDGTVTFRPEEAGLKPRSGSDGSSCSIDGSGC
ncbi:glutaredoxin-related protein [Xylanibacter muris]|uniref:Glutaredoxin-related protein n=1 Tax=Xylanibacter muris TaxID=2736290 RepID=A0ABX2APM5_9BACT|nr:glutaredoxin-related protein [Xylanibacter muris]NPD92923.1 glutaredoxin-related protein [Xylanibacter muris]